MCWIAGRAIAQSVLACFPAGLTKVRPFATAGGQRGIGDGFLGALHIPLHTHPSSEAGTVDQSVADVASWLNLNQAQRIKEMLHNAEETGEVQTWRVWSVASRIAGRECWVGIVL
jgi:hypothetical protein